MATANPGSHRNGNNHEKIEVDTTRPRKPGRVIVDFLKESWSDILTIAAFGIAALGIYQAPLVAKRTFPVTFTQSGDIVYPSLGYPDRGWILSSLTAGLLSTLIPLGLIVLVQIRVRSFTDMSSAVMGLLYAVVLGTVFQTITKTLIGGFRPYFLQVCQPDVSREYAAAHNTSGLSGVGYHQAFFSTDVCTTTDKAKLKVATTSFPSGHSTAAWCGYFFLFLYLNAKLKVWADYRPRLWKLPVLFAPILGATLISCSLTIDQAHNWYDVVGGTVIGLTFSTACYRAFYAAVWDWRFNHVPLRPRENFVYATGPDMRRDHALFTRHAGWGPQHVGKAALATSHSGSAAAAVPGGMSHPTSHAGMTA